MFKIVDFIILPRTPCQLTGADPGFPVGGGTNAREAGAYDFAKLSKKKQNCIKLRTF